MQHWPPNLASEHTEPSWCASAFLVASSWDTWDPVSFSLWQQSMGQCGYSFLSTTNKVTQRLSVLYQRLSSSSSFLSSSKQHVEGDILFTIGARSLHQRTLLSSYRPSNVQNARFDFFLFLFKCWTISIHLISLSLWCIVLMICETIIRHIQYLTCCGAFRELCCFANECLLPHSVHPFLLRSSFFISFG